MAAASAAAGAAEEEGTRVERVATTRSMTDLAVEAVHTTSMVSTIQQRCTPHWQAFHQDIIPIMDLLLYNQLMKNFVPTRTTADCIPLRDLHCRQCFSSQIVEQAG